MRGGATFRSLSAHNYRLFFLGALVSNIGTWMGRTAQSWLVLVELTDHSGEALGLVTAAQFLPSLLLAPWTGLIADRFRKRRVLIVTQLGMGLVQGFLAVLVLTDLVTLPLVYVCAFVLGLFAAVDTPTRQAFVSEVVGPELLPNAVGLNSANFNAARLLGPGLAGLMIALVGTGWAMLADALSFLAIVGTLTAMNPGQLLLSRRSRGKGQIRAGISYVAGRPDILLVMAIVFLQGTFGMNFQMTNALMATTVFGKGPGEYGILGSIMAIGSLAAALGVARRARARLRTLVAALGAFAVTTTAAALAPTYESFALLLIPVGLSAMTILPTANSYVQMGVEPEMRGRVMALYMAIFLGGTPIGSPLIGWVAGAFGARAALLVGALSALVAMVGALTYLLGFRGLRVRYRIGARPHLIVEPPARSSEPAQPLPEVAA